MKVGKGDFGYIRYQRKIRILKTAALFVLPAALFIAGLIMNGGDRKNILTLLAIVGVIPACMSVVSVVMVFLRSSVSEELYNDVHSRSQHLSDMYEVFFTTHDQNLYVSALVIDDDYVTGYSEDNVDAGVLNVMEKHISSCLRVENMKRKVKIFSDRKHFLDRVEEMDKKNTDHDKSNDSTVIGVIKAISV